MSDDPKKKQNEGTGSSGQTGQQSGQKPGQESEQPRDVSNKSQKRRSQGGSERDEDREQNEQGGQRRATQIMTVPAGGILSRISSANSHSKQFRRQTSRMKDTRPIS